MLWNIEVGGKYIGQELYLYPEKIQDGSQQDLTSFLEFFAFFLSVPGKPPTNVTAKSKTSTAIEVTWLCIDCQQHNFTVGFLVSYKPNSNNQTVGRSVNRTVRELLITGMKKYTNYTIYVTSITIWGQGLSSERLSIRTQEDGKCRETYGLLLNSVKRKPTAI